MTDRVYPSAKPNGAAAASAAAPLKPAVSTQPLPTVNPPPNKAAKLYNPNLRRPAAPRRHQKHRSSCTFRRCFCLTCCWLILILIAILLLAVIASGAFYFLYHPDRPAFSVTSLKLLQFNLSTIPPDDSTHLTAKMNLTLNVRNPNGKFSFSYDPATITVKSEKVTLGNFTFASFTSPPDNETVIHTTIGPYSQVIDPEDLNQMNSDLKRRIGIPIEVVMDTMIGVKMESKVKMNKVGIIVKCSGIHGVVPKKKGKVVIPTVANTARAKCKVDLRIKIWKFTFN